MGMTILLDLAKKFLPQIIIAVILVAGYFYWRHDIYEQGVEHEQAECNADKAEVSRESTELKLTKEHEVWDAKLEDSERYLAAIGIYSQVINGLNDELDQHRADGLRVLAKRPACSGNTMPRKADNTKKDSGSSGAIYAAELEPETARTIRDNATEVAIGAAACKELLDEVKVHFEVK